MRTANSYPGKTDDSDIDMTPMLDIVFIMLIFFIVTASFTHEIGLELSGQKNQNNIIEKKDISMLVGIDASGRIWIDGIAADIDAVKPTIKRLSAQNQAVKVFIQVDAQTRTDLMMQVLDQSRAAGIDASLLPVR
jgi:biopolymer transport protein ExbD